MNPTPDNSAPTSISASQPAAATLSAPAPAQAQTQTSATPFAAAAAAVVAPRPPISAVKLPDTRRFVSPMPSIEEADDEVPAFLPIIAGIAACVTIAFAVLLYLKN